jgi:hypothetical protein
MSHDYQKAMSSDTVSTDQLGEQAAEDTTAENSGVHQEWVKRPGRNGTTIKELKGTFGMVPEERIDTPRIRWRRTTPRTLTS